MAKEFKTHITKRMKPCNCGCKGRDPWHKESYRRVLRNKLPSAGDVRTAWEDQTPIQAEAVASFPWGETRVVQMRKAPGRPAWWMIDLDDMLNVMNRRIAS